MIRTSAEKCRRRKRLMVEQWSRVQEPWVRNLVKAVAPFGKALILIAVSFGEDLKASIPSITYLQVHSSCLDSQVKLSNKCNQEKPNQTRIRWILLQAIRFITRLKPSGNSIKSVNGVRYCKPESIYFGRIEKVNKPIL